MSISFIRDETGNIPSEYKQKSSENASTFTAFFFFLCLRYGQKKINYCAKFSVSLSVFQCDFPFVATARETN